ncbi:MAG TPA: hypothetical protein VKB50_30075 [Vicinamibacterales bacterium]|nr:hypothetical protein [Vicinamibacterales bacterium]
MTRPSRLRIVVLGYIVRGPLGGLAWHHLQYVLGLARLGHDVFFLEDSDDYASCYDPVRNVMDRDPTYGLDFIDRVFTRLGLGTGWAYYDQHQNAWLGPAARQSLEICRSADVVLNLSAVNPVRSWLEHVPVRVLVDTDPAFTQIRHLTNATARARAAAHTAFFSYGENIQHEDCAIPRDGFPWQPTRQPMVMDAWAPTPGPPRGPLSTVMLWDSYPSADFDGVHYGMKAESFDPYVDLPSHTRERFHLALGSSREPRERLAAHGWTILDPRVPTRDPWTYQDFIQRSKAEFSVAKHGYVVSRSGWFSERSAAYLASGRPVVVQDTGFSCWLDADAGVIPFRHVNEAIAAIDVLNASYERQCLAARALAEAYFDSSAVLTQLLERALAASPTRGLRTAS